MRSGATRSQERPRRVTGVSFFNNEIGERWRRGNKSYPKIIDPFYFVGGGSCININPCTTLHTPASVNTDKSDKKASTRSHLTGLAMGTGYGKDPNLHGLQSTFLENLRISMNIHGGQNNL